MECVAIVGASLAGMRAASTLRDEGFQRSIIIVVGDELHPPYDRPPLSKQFLAGKWDESRISLVCPPGQDRTSSVSICGSGHRAVALDHDAATRSSWTTGHRVRVRQGVIATGSHPRALRGTELGAR